ncbi:MAG: LptF/LptG family permease [Verrucomicrobiota bacterium]
MKLVDRYIGRQLLVTLTFAIAVLSFVLVVGNIFRKLLPLLVNHDVPIDYLVSFVAYILPFSLIFTIPWGLLTAVLLVFGRLSADNELIALRSNGFSIGRLCLPLAVIALVATAVSLWLNLQIAPAAQEQMRSTVFNLASRNPMALFGSDQIIEQFPGRKIYVGKKEGNQLENILVFETNDDAMPMKVTHAKSGMLEADLPNKRILMHLYNARYQQRDEANPFDLQRIRDGISAEEGTLPISLEELYEKEKRRQSRSMQSVAELIDQLKTGDRKARSATRTEINRRFAFPVACLVFALFGVPLGITTHRRETSFGFGVSLVIGVFYFLFIILAGTLRANPKLHPELLVWVPNILVFALGLWLFRRLSRQ